jgi:hypothetical protein
MVKSLKGWKFTTKTKTHQTIRSTISNVLQNRGIGKFTSLEEQNQDGLDGPRENQSQRPRADREDQLSPNAISVAVKSRSKTTISKSEISVPCPVLRNGIGIVDCTIKNGNANIAEGTSQPTNHLWPDFALSPVLTISDGPTIDVYNLEVEEVPEYFANGILVHNCARNFICAEPGGAISFAKPLQVGRYQAIGC